MDFNEKCRADRSPCQGFIPIPPLHCDGGFFKCVGHVVSGCDLTPLILFAASPGTITGVITLSVAHSALGLPLTALVAVSVACAATLLILLLSIRMGSGSQKGDSLLRDTVSRFMGLIVLAMGIQFALSGLKSFFS